ncbi:hypothetical protein [Streptomonospora litoralis]|uniref:Uncharacterized protein n=1 Tax=Streptomonospora litoralis TaxID=2498135 RepID=A0A4P6Q5I5_9ACTN|nr:hypothetical protein [Streptomonospora litoralis]QBI55893.1 hypothetical protein EKD16_20670 [Streptomonospora litoralis]
MSTIKTRAKRMWLVVAVAVAAVPAFALVVYAGHSNWVMTTIVTAVVCLGLWGVLRVHLRPEEATDSQRAESGSFLDERDRSISMAAFAIMGGIALVFSLIGVYSTLLFGMDAQFFVTTQFLMLMVAYPLAIRYFAKRR